MPSIPGALMELGKVFVPIEPGEKGPRVPRTEGYLRTAENPVMQAYLEAGHSYGITMRGDLAVLDADEPDDLEPIIEALPETVWQVSGSRESEHYFLRVPGLDSDVPLDHPRTGDHVGHIKASEQSVIVGPGSRHQSGNRYGPLRDVDAGIAHLSEGELWSLIGPYARDSVRIAVRDAVTVTLAHAARVDVEAVLPLTTDVVDPFLENCGPKTPGTTVDPDDVDVDHPPVDLDVYDVLDRSSYPEGERRAHPFHGSDTGSNFVVNEGGETWCCWRNCGNASSGVTAGHASYLLGMEQGVISCGDWVNGGLDAQTWREIFDAARSAGYNIPTPTESGPDPSDVARCPECDWALGDHRRDPFDPTAFRCDRCDRKVTEDEAFAHAE